MINCIKFYEHIKTLKGDDSIKVVILGHPKFANAIKK